MKLTKKLVFLALCLIVAAGMVFAGPGGQKGAGGKLKIVYIPKDTVNPYFYAIDVGFKEAIAELGADKFEYVYTGPATAGPTDQVEYIQAAVQNKSTAIFLSANHESALNRYLDEARDAGVKVIIMNQDIPGSESHRDVAIMPASFANVGPLLVELMGKQLNYQGDFAIISATTDAPDQNTWIAGIKQELASNSKYSRMKLVDVVYGDDQPEKSATEMEALITKYPNLKGVIAPTAAGIPAVAKVIQTRRLTGRIKLTGLGLPSTMKEFVDDGTCEAFALWNPPYEGYLGVYLVDAISKGYNPAPGSTFKAGKLGDVSIESNGQILTLKDLMVYDKSNIDQYAPLF
ncbi:MAG: substrate-binding domain-containing protein [Treponema sp.]|jgi:rhamnose transport system substrate-binding protein|nr:substrate-binding domain-containing protein [Treponema sp.]